MIPQTYNLPHSNWREHQEPTLDWCFGIDGTGVLEAPTGSGKTALPAALSTRKSVVSLCQTKFLQADNYERGYSFDAHYGRSNYACVHPDGEGLTCAECLHLEEGMYKCKHSQHCFYLLSKSRAKASPKASLNYAYWLSSRWMKNNPPSVLFLDEAHNLSEIVTRWSGCTVTEKQRIDFSLPDFPKILSSTRNELLDNADPVGTALSWLSKSRTILRARYVKEKALARTGSRKARRLLAECEKLGRKVGNVLEMLTKCREDWYIRSGKSALSFGRESRPGFVVKPLTAKHHFPSLFLNGYDTIAMSATIGNPNVFSEELGIDRFAFRTVPHRFPASDRPVHILDCPGMGRKAKAEDFEHQADVVAKSIHSVDRSWCGFILVTRKSEARFLADRLARRGLQERVWVSSGWDGSYTPTDIQLKEWEKRKRKVPNSLWVTWSAWEGVDGLDERILIEAKIPFGFLGDDFERERMYYSGKMYRQRAGWQTEQGLGRTRRGREQDYGSDSGLVAIADGNWNRVKNYLSENAREALIIS